MLTPPQLEKSWGLALQEEFQKPYMTKLKDFIAEERSGPVSVFPSAREVFSAFNLTPFEQVKVVIVGQDPYHGAGQAHGLCFSVQPGITIPPSLQNIYQELHQDIGFKIPKHGCLTAWAKQGVLLLNATLTVRQATPLSHHGQGWEIFTDAVIHLLCQRNEPIVFLLWGKSAQQKCHHVTPSKTCLILTASHPSPYSVHGFFGCRHFSKTNQFLVSLDKKPIDWSITD